MTRKNRQERRERPVRDRFIASVLAGGIVAGLVIVVGRQCLSCGPGRVGGQVSRPR